MGPAGDASRAAWSWARLRSRLASRWGRHTTELRQAVLGPIIRRRAVRIGSDATDHIAVGAPDVQPRLASRRFVRKHVVARRRIEDASEVVSETIGLDPFRLVFPTNQRWITLLARVRVQARHGVAQAPGFRLIADTVVMQGKFSGKAAAGKFSRRLPLIRFDVPVAMLSMFNNHYINWRESLTRIPALFEPEVEDLPRLVLAYNDEFASEGAELLARIVPKNVELVRVPRNSLLEAPLFVDLPQVESFAVSPRVVQGVRTVLEPVLPGVASGPTDVIYIRRPENSKRRAPVNEAALLPELARRGVRAVMLEELPFEAQLRVFRRAAAVVAQHGAGLANLFASPPGQSVLEIHSNPAEDARHHYRALAASCGLDYSALFGAAEHPNSPTLLPVDEVVDWIDTAI